MVSNDWYNGNKIFSAMWKIKEVSWKIKQKDKNLENNRTWMRQLEDQFRKSNIQIQEIPQTQRTKKTEEMKISKYSI